jgi:signal transduction histidine kinase
LNVEEQKIDKSLETITSIITVKDPETVIKKVADEVADAFGFQDCDAFLYDDNKKAYALMYAKGYPQEIEARIAGLTRTADDLRKTLAEAERLGRFTYLIKAKPGQSSNGYYGLRRPEKAHLPRLNDDDWHELDVLFVTFEDGAGNIVGYLEPDVPKTGKLPTHTTITNLEIFASLASVALENARLVSTLESMVKNYKALLDSTAALQEPSDLKSTIESIAKTLEGIVPFDEISVYLVDWERNLLVPVYATGDYADEVMMDVGPLSGVAGIVARTGKMETVEDTRTDPRLEAIPGLEDDELSETMLAAPLIGTAQVEGVLELCRDKSNQFTASEWEMIGPFAAHAAIAIENAKLHEQLKKDFESVRKSYQEMKALDEMKDSLVDTVSHEMRTPLTTIMGYLEMAQAGLYGEVPPKLLEKFETILSSIRRINLLVEKMLEMSRVEKGDVRLDFDDVNIAMITREILSELDAEIRMKGHRVQTLFGNELPVVTADRLRIHDVVENFISNAVKYTDPGGTITVGADILGGKMHFWVKDTGIGIAEEDKSKIFDRFFLAGTGLVRADNRIGIGLYVSREIVRNHGGDMWFESERGAGSTFHFTVPMTQPLRRGRAPATAGPETGL